MTSSKKRTSAKKQPKPAKSSGGKSKTKAMGKAAKKAPAKAVKVKKTGAASASPKSTAGKKAPASPKAKSTQKAPLKKTTAKAVKKVTAKTAKKATVKTTTAKKAAVKKATSRKTDAKKTPATSPRPARKAAVKKSSRTHTESEETSPETDPNTKAIVLGARRRKGTPAVFKTGLRKNTPIVFSLDDVHDILRQKDANGHKSAQKKVETTQPVKVETKTAAQAAKEEPEPPKKKRVLGAASLADILGFNPADKNSKRDDADVPRKWIKYYRLLMELRNHVRDELDIHTQQTLKRSAKEDAGDLSGYGQHMADAGTDTFDRDFALSLVSNEQEALYEINEAIKRIHAGTYGVCEITNQPINRERLMAVPFTRYSLEGQRELEKNKRRTRNRNEVGVFTDTDDSGAMSSDDDSDS